MDYSETKTYPNVGQAFGIFGVSVVLTIIVLFFSQLLNNKVGVEIPELLSYLFIVGGTFYLFHKIRKRKTGRSSYNFSLSTGKIVVIVSIATIGLQLGVTGPLISLIPMSESMEKFFQELMQEEDFFAFVTAVIVAPFLEELIFRGLILDGFLRIYSPIKSILFSSFLFGIFHLNPWQFVSAMVIGVFSGWVYYKTGKLTLCIIIHFVNNLFAYIGFYLIDSEYVATNNLVDRLGGIGPSIALITIGIILAGTCIYLLIVEFEELKTVQWSRIDTPVLPEEDMSYNEIYD